MALCILNGGIPFRFVLICMICDHSWSPLIILIMPRLLLYTFIDRQFSPCLSGPFRYAYDRWICSWKRCTLKTLVLVLITLDFFFNTSFTFVGHLIAITIITITIIFTRSNTSNLFKSKRLSAYHILYLHI